MKTLPIDQILPKLLETISTHPNTILHAPPGAGKTTRVPLAFLENLAPEAGRIVMLEPRRLAAVSAARYMAKSIGEDVGRTVGYSIRFDSRVSHSTRIEVVTEGILTRRIQDDPLLEGVGMVIFDEFHERSLQADLGLALCLDVQRQVRPDLKLLVMSATLDCAPLIQLLGDALLISSEGRSYPVEEIYLEDHNHRTLKDKVVAAIHRALKETEGDILVFLPGAGEIRACAAALDTLALSGVTIHQLYGDLAFDEQQRAILPGKLRKVVLSTSLAETSLTIEGVSVVIDCGLSRRLRHDLASGMNRLVTVRESRASAEQRKGRAGRLGPGRCYRLFSQHTFSAMTPHTPAEILEADLSPLLLDLAAWGVTPADLDWLDNPPEAAVAVASQLLQSLSALDANCRINAVGGAMATMPLHPRLSRLLLRAKELGCFRLGCDLAALLSERDVLRRGPGMTEKHLDLEDRLGLLQQWREKGSNGGVADKAALQAVERVAGQLLKLGDSKAGTSEDPANLARLILTAYPDRLARQREGQPDRYLLANGRGARLVGQLSTPLLVAVSVDGGQGEGQIHLSQAVSEELVRSELSQRIEQKDSVYWDEREGRVVALRGAFLGAVELAAAPYVPEPEASLPVVLETLRNNGLGLLYLNENFLQLRARMMLLHTKFPEDSWPDVTDSALLARLENWLGPYLSSVRTKQQLAQVDCATALKNLLDYRQQRALDELAPTHLPVPSGSRIRLDYCEGDLPVLAVKLQELFGLAETPTVAGGRQPVLLHLLSPAGRPIQVTQDLKGFWDGAYHQVKKELKGRYPKHPWPDDPWNAIPTRKTKAKM